MYAKHNGGGWKKQWEENKLKRLSTIDMKVEKNCFMRQNCILMSQCDPKVEENGGQMKEIVWETNTGNYCSLGAGYGRPRFWMWFTLPLELWCDANKAYIKCKNLNFLTLSPCLQHGNGAEAAVVTAEIRNIQNKGLIPFGTVWKVAAPHGTSAEFF